MGTRSYTCSEFYSIYLAYQTDKALGKRGDKLLKLYDANFVSCKYFLKYRIFKNVMSINSDGHPQ